MYEKVSAALIAKLHDALGAERLRVGDSIGADYTHDELPGGKAFTPEAVVEASSTSDVAAVLKLCFENAIPVTVHGAGTGKVGGSVPVQGGIVLSMKNMNGILSFDESAKALTVQPGVLLQEIKDEASKHELCYPPDPGEKTATIGGNAATDAGGPCALKYGSTRDYVLDAELVFADGSVAKLSDKAEYSAVVGSEGTLAVITQLKLKLIESPAKNVILLLPFMDAESCIAAGARIIEAGFEPCAMEYLDTDLVEFSGKLTGNPVFPIEMDGERVGATMMLSLEGASDDELDEKMEAVAELAEKLECLDILVVDTPTLKRDTWAAHDAFHSSLETVKCADEINISLPINRLSEQVEHAKSLGAELGIAVYTYAHIGSGGLHIHMAAEEKDNFEAFTKAMYEKCIELGGDARGEYGFGYVKNIYNLNADKSLKQQLDTKGIMNPGKVV